MDKLNRKNCDLIVGNDVSQEGAGFGGDTNVVRIYDRNGLVEALPIQSKKNVARRLLELAADRMYYRSGENPDVRQSHCRCPGKTNEPGIRL